MIRKYEYVTGNCEYATVTDTVTVSFFVVSTPPPPHI